MTDFLDTADQKLALEADGIVGMDQVVPHGTVLEREPTRTEQLFCEVLAEVMEVEAVSAGADFFDELGADSLVMTHFCARLSKRPDLPSVSIKDIYQYPSIASLADALSGVATETAPAPAESRPMTPAATAHAPPAVTPLEVEPSERQHLICGAKQLLVVMALMAVAAFLVHWGYSWITASSGFSARYVRAGIFGVQ